MISPRLQQRLLSRRCLHSAASSQSARAAHMTQRRLASSSTPSRQPSRAPTSKRTTAPIPAGIPTAAAAQRARANAEKEVPPSLGPVETAEEYKARYKSAARRWTSTIIALPILLVTSYYLFDRLALGHAQKVLNREPTKRDN